MFVNRNQELNFLNNLLSASGRRNSQLILLYGRRRVGKTVLLRHWAQQSDLSYTYWSAEKETAPLQRRKLFAQLLNVSINHAPLFDSWGELWSAAAELLGEKKHILILDELPYAAESDSATLSALQHAWDQHFQNSQSILILCGSHVRTMETLLTRQSPLFGRMTGQWHLMPLSFASLRAFFPNWSAQERVAAYAIAGGIPAYLEWLQPQRSLVENIRHVILSPGSMFIAEPQFLLYDEVREPQTYLAILKAMGAGHRTLAEISNASLVSKTHLSAYLKTLQQLRLVERRIPVTVPHSQRRQSRQGRYHLSDPYFRFYFRFLDPYQDILTLEPERVLESVRTGLRAFVGQSAFELLAQEWVRQQGRLGQLPLQPDSVGSHWSRHVQIDVVAINWQNKEILLGECKWTQDPIDRQIVRELIEQKLPKVKKDLLDNESGNDWRVFFAFFSRHGFTEAARSYAQFHASLLVDLAQIDAELQE